ncbi:uncharacterized protein LOC119735245 [Patiria miniata]|uniref:Tripartite motif-containing protein 2-like n=1 Tax=Patiria miniata TaxID=46514 RepID=A0A914AMQ5_PATMI|nr:uncharacterized protein LOC119735245 [Patiria miniata]
MATAASVGSAFEKIGIHLECSICTEKYKNPKETVLPQSGIQGLKTNFRLVGLIEEFELQEKVACSGDSKFLCETCDEDNEALHHCLDCGMNICTTCRKTHLRFPVSANHAVATLDDIRQGKDTIEAKKIAKSNIAKARKGVQGRAAEVIAEVKSEEKRLLDEITTSKEEQIRGLYPHKLWYLRFKKSQTAGVIDLGEVEHEGDKWQLHHEFGKRGSGEGEFKGARGIAAAAEPGEIAVTDGKNKRVVIYNNQGQAKNTILTVANDVVALSHQWVCAHPEKIMVYHRDTTHKCDFHTVPDDEVGKTDVLLVSVAVKPNGNIMVGDKKMKALIELNLRNGAILHTMPLKIRPDFLAVMSNGWIVVSDWEQGQVEIVDVSGGNPVTVATIKPTIGGKPVKSCRGVCSNSSGIYFAAITGKVNTGHIHHHGRAGQFISCVAQGLYDPYGITITADGQQMAVADLYSCPKIICSRGATVLHQGLHHRFVRAPTVHPPVGWFRDDDCASRQLWVSQAVPCQQSHPSSCYLVVQLREVTIELLVGYSLRPVDIEGHPEHPGVAAIKRLGHDSIGAHLECSICTDKYKQPKVLNCLHSFCEECLVKYRDGTHRGAPQIPCPVCCQETVLPQSGIQGLKTNFHLVGMIEEFELQEKVACSRDSKLLCETCDEENEALHHCLDCGMNICTTCRRTHLRFPVSANHAVETLNDIRQGKVNVTKKPDQSKCHKHKEGVTQFYCKTCDELICQVCTVLDHSKPDHDIIDIAKASKGFRQSLRKGFSAFEEDIKGLEVSLQGVASSKKLLNDNTVTARKRVQGRAADVIAKVKAEEKQLLDEITTQEKEQHKRLDEHKKTLSSLLHRKKHCLQTSQEVTKNASDSHFLSLHPVISTDMDKLRGQPTPTMAGLKLHPVFVKSKNLDIDLGKVMVEDTWEQLQCFGKQGSGEGEFESASGIAAAADPDEIAVADWKNKRVVICNSQGPTKKYLPINANDVVAVSNQWVCANPGKMMVYDRDTTHKFDFRTVPDDEVGKTAVRLASMAVMPNGNIIAGDKERKVLTVHNPRNGEILHTMPVKIKPDFLAVLSNGWIVISDSKQGLVEIVEVSNGNAVTVTRIQPTIDGKPVKNCQGVCSNSSGIYLAMDTGYVNTGHIHHYNCAGQFVSCVAQGLYNPCGITFTEDGQQLAVADLYSVKIYHKV